nr:hypothetical protein [Methylobacterium sp. B34]
MRAYGHEKQDSCFDVWKSAFRASAGCRGGSARQRAGAGPTRLRPALGLPGTGLRPVPGAHLEAWTRDIADQRCHGTTGEAPIERFRREEAEALKPLAGIPPFTTARDLVRRVGTDCAVAAVPALLRPLAEYEAVAGGGF